MTFAFFTGPSKPHRDAMEAALGAKGYGRAFIAPLGKNWVAQSKANFQANLDDCFASGQVPDVWSTISDEESQAGALTPALAEAGPAAEQAAMLATYVERLKSAGLPVQLKWRILYEQYRSVTWGVPLTQVADTIDAIAAKAPAGVLVACAMEPASLVGKVKPADLPDGLPLLARAAEVDIFWSLDAPDPAKNDPAKMQLTLVWLGAAIQRGMLIGVGESALQDGKTVSSIADAGEVNPALGALLQFASTTGCAYLSLESNMPGTDFVAACPPATAFLRKKLAKGSVLLAPTPLIAVPAGGTTSVGSVQAVD